MKILLTGAAGQLGRAVQEAFAGHTLDARDRSTLDVGDADAVARALDESEPALVLNAAAYTDVDGAEADPDAAFAGNARAPELLARATATRGVTLLHVSTDYVFDGSGERPYLETDAPNPRSVYGRSKLAGEEAVREHNPRHFIVRTAWLYAEQGRNFVLTMRRLAAGEQVQVVDDQYGSPTYALHLARALETLVQGDAYGTVHLAGSGVASWWELTRALYQELGCATPVRPVKTEAFPRPAPRPAYSALGSGRQPPLSLPPWREGLRECVGRMSPAPSG